MRVPAPADDAAAKAAAAVVVVAARAERVAAVSHRGVADPIAALQAVRSAALQDAPAGLALVAGAGGSLLGA